MIEEPVYDVRQAMAPKSDQLNADDLIAGPITVQIIGIDLQKVTGEKGQQPLSVKITAPYKPWRPCKSMMRVLSDQWGSNAAKWIGRWVTLYRDPSVKFGGDAVGGIRISHMSHIPKRATLAITLTRGQRAPYHVEPLTPPTTTTDAPDLPWLLGWLKAGTSKGWTPEAIAELLRAHGSPDGKAATLPADKRREVAAIVKEPPGDEGPDLSEFGTPPWEKEGGQ